MSMHGCAWRCKSGKRQRMTRWGLAQKVGELIAGSADVPSALSAQREKPLVMFPMRMICLQRDADGPSDGMKQAPPAES